VAALAFTLLRLGPARWAWLAARADARWLALAGALAAAVAYALVAGWGVPVRRALLLLAALAMGVVAGRGRAGAEPLALAALLILTFEPDALFAAGAQLSFAATAALLFARQREQPDGWLGGLARTSATALVATAPLAALHFGSRAPFALAVNLVAVPWTGAVLLPCALASLLAASFPGLPVAATLMWLGERVAAGTLAVAAWAAERLPGAASGPPPDPWWLAGAAFLGLLGLSARGTAARIAAAVGVAVLINAADGARLLPGVPRVVFLDVGQGDASLVQGRAGALLVDAGTALEGGPDLGRLAVLPALAALGVGRLDLVVASHADLDHRGGLPAVLAALPVGEVWVPRGALGEEGFEALEAMARERGVALHERGQGDAPARYGDLVVAALWPPGAAVGVSRNDRSLVVRVDLNGRRLLFPGDIEAGAEARLLASGADLRVDVLKLPHHGSRSSSTPNFLAAAGAAVGVVSAPCWGRFGMPHERVLAASREAGHGLWWTGRDGAVWVALEGPLRVSSSGDPRQCR
jgi:competence protein ComEC